MWQKKCPSCITEIQVKNCYIKGGVVNLAEALDSLGKTRKIYFDWLNGLAWTKKLYLALLVASITGIAAQLRIPLPFTPVPITGQVFVVLLSGVVLGHVYGGLSMILYVLIGFAGMPWFSGSVSGLPISPTTGYILGFIPAALLVGLVTQRYKQNHSFLNLIGLMMIAVSIIYTFGALYFIILMQSSIQTTLYLAVLPFIPVDLAKALAAACIARALLPHK
jgi:biotin transport system substrate-specific component